MAWHLGGSWDGASIAQDLPTIMAQLETAVIERENMVFGLSTAAKVAADFDGYALYWPGHDSEPTVYDWIVTLRLRIERLLANSLISTSTAPAITDKFAVFTNAARDKILATATSGDLLSVFSLTDYTSGWLGLSGRLVSDFHVWEQLRQTLEAMVYVCWSVAPRREDSEDIAFLDETPGSAEDFWDWMRGAGSAPTGGVNSAGVVYSNDGNTALSGLSQSNGWLAGVWLLSTSISSNQGVFHQSGAFELKTDNIVGTIDAAYFTVTKHAQAIGPDPWSLTSDFEFTYEGETYSISGGDGVSTVETEMTDWPTTTANEVVTPSWGSTPTDIPLPYYGSIADYVFFEVEFFFAPNSVGFVNDQTIYGTRVHTDITGELTYG